MNWTAALITVIVGPLTFFIWSHFFIKDKNLTKFPTGFNDGIGDTIFLPWFNGVAFSALVWNPLVAAIGIVIGVLVTRTYVDYQKKETYLDWSKPKPGTLNAGGWYHAFFMFAQVSIGAYALLTIFSWSLVIPLIGYLLTTFSQIIWKGYI